MGSDTPTMPGNVGPDLSMVGGKFSDEHLFKQIYDARLINKHTVMPPWGTHKVYTPEEILDMVAFLQTLKQPAKLKDDLENPMKRPVPVEDRDNLDVFTNPSILAWEKGRDLFEKAGPNGKACNSCHAKPEKTFKTWATSMPKWEPRMGKVLGVEEFITRHGRATTEVDYLMQSDENLALAIYLRRLSNGQPIKVDIKSPGAREAAERAKRLMERKIGQLNFACIDCHQKAANKWIRGQWLGEFKGQIDHFPTWRTSQSLIWDIRKRFQWCGVAIRANELPPEATEYGELELYLTALNNGAKMNVPGIRH
jgi:sulfur-oxidizing protein SoxA